MSLQNQRSMTLFVVSSVVSKEEKNNLELFYHHFKDVGLYQYPDIQTLKQHDFFVSRSKVKATKNYTHWKLCLTPTEQVLSTS